MNVVLKKCAENKIIRAKAGIHSLNMHLLEIDPGHRWEARFRGDLICVSPPSQIQCGSEKQRMRRNSYLKNGLKK